MSANTVRPSDGDGGGSARAEVGDAAFVRAFLANVRNRIAFAAAVRGIGVGFAITAIVTLLRQSSPAVSLLTTVVDGAIVVGSAFVAMRLSAGMRSRAAVAIEKRVNCDNLVVTADELDERPARASSQMVALVQRQAATVLRRLDVEALFPTKQAWIVLAIGVFSAAIAQILPMVYERAGSNAASSGTTGVATIGDIEATVTAPAYAGRAQQILKNPARIEALAGSRVQLTVHATAASIVVETLLGKQTLTSSDQKTFTGDVTADADGFIALGPSTSAGKVGTRKLIGLSVTPDRAPHVRITAPGRDMLFPDGNHAIDIAVDADDDLALGTLKLRYTKVSGSGERYTFSEGELPIQITRTNETNWKARVHWDLRSLQLASGDMVVYRAVATDKRPGAPATESDSYIAEIRLGDGDAAAGFAVDPEQERYALSQQMIIVKTERLLAKKSTLSTQAFADEANDIAVEQRRVRAEFVFMMGGELADIPDPQEDMTTLHEESEAESESDILDGRGANTGRLALVRAVRAMSGAAQLLNTAVVPEALSREKIALTQLERAFSHTRILLRALTQAEKLDLSRRMTGPLVDVGRDQHPIPHGEVSARVVALRGALAGIAELLAVNTGRTDASARASELAERVLRVDPSAKPLQAIATQLNEAAAHFGKLQTDNARHSLELAAVSLTSTLRAEIIAAPQQSRSFDGDRLDGAIADALRGARGPK
ncbi:MAG: hypothetical protein ABJB66_13080 [Gemmatimonadaceae bacterium]